MKQLTTQTFLMVLGTAFCLSGCGTKPAAQPSITYSQQGTQHINVTTQTTAAVPISMQVVSPHIHEINISLLTQADNDFKSQSYDDAITNYKDALKSIHKNRHVTTHDVKKYVINQLSSCYLCKAIEDAKIAEWGNAEDDCEKAIAFVLSNKVARKLLKIVAPAAKQQGQTMYTAYQIQQERIAGERAIQVYKQWAPAFDNMQRQLETRNPGNSQMNGPGNFGVRTSANSSQDYPIIDPQHQVGDHVLVTNAQDGSTSWESAEDIQQRQQQADADAAAEQSRHDQLSHQLGYDNPNDAPPGTP